MNCRGDHYHCGWCMTRVGPFCSVTKDHEPDDIVHVPSGELCPLCDVAFNAGEPPPPAHPEAAVWARPLRTKAHRELQAVYSRIGYDRAALLKMADDIEADNAVIRERQAARTAKTARVCNWKRLTKEEIETLDPIDLYMSCDPKTSYGETRFQIGRAPRDSVLIDLGCPSPHGDGAVTWIDHEKRTYGCSGSIPVVGHLGHCLPKRHHRVNGRPKLICEEETG